MGLESPNLLKFPYYGGAGGVLPAGTVVNSTLRWDGTSWVENVNLLAFASGTLELGDNTAAIGITAKVPAASALDIALNNGTNPRQSAYTMSDAAGGIHVWRVNNADEMWLLPSDLRPAVNNGLSLGATAQRWNEGWGTHWVGNGISADGDVGGTLGQLTFTNVSNALTSGTITLTDARSGLVHDGYMTMYVGTLTRYFPYFRDDT